MGRRATLSGQIRRKNRNHTRCHRLSSTHVTGHRILDKVLDHFQRLCQGKHDMERSSPVFDASTMEVVCHGLGYSEGPIAMPDGTLLLVDIKNECLTRIRP